MILSDVLLQILQVLCVLLLAPLLQGFILKVEERVQRSRGPSIFQPYRDLWKLFHKELVVPDSASWIFFAAPIIAFTAMLTVPILIPVLTDRPLPLSDMGDMLGGGLILTLGSFAIILAGLDTGNVYGVCSRRFTPSDTRHFSGARSAAIFFLGVCVLALAVGMPWWLHALGQGSHEIFGVDAAAQMRDGWLLVPLSNKFAFISPSKMLVVCPLLALIPIAFFLLSRRAFHVRRVPVWSGGRREDARQIATTSLAFSNALRTFYGFIYGPTHNLEREYDHGPYFVKRLIFNQEVAPIFGPYFFSPLVKATRRIADEVSKLQSGYLNLYNALIGMLLVLILGLALFYK